MGEAGDGVAGRTRPPPVGTCTLQLRSVSNNARWLSHPSAHWNGGTATPSYARCLRHLDFF
ncbi:MAG: hypothetical protein IKT27_00275 [Clostridia bacterium]|nr:hypothetical protein [Clostridia bacterium]